MTTQEILRILQVLNADPLSLSDAIVKLMNEDKEFFKAMHIAMFNNEL